MAPISAEQKSMPPKFARAAAATRLAMSGTQAQQTICHARLLFGEMPHARRCVLKCLVICVCKEMFSHPPAAGARAQGCCRAGAHPDAELPAAVGVTQDPPDHPACSSSALADACGQQMCISALSRAHPAVLVGPGSAALTGLATRSWPHKAGDQHAAREHCC